MQWLNTIVDELIKRQPTGVILVESGASPSGTYHLGHMRELVTSDAIILEIRRRGREARHVQFVDDLDALRKIPVNVSSDYEKYLGMPLCDVPAPDGSKRSYASFFLQGLIDACGELGIDVEFVLSHEKYRSGYFVPSFERVLEHIEEARSALASVSGRKLDEHWTPIQVMENGRLKNRKYLGISKTNKTIDYEDSEGESRTVSYGAGEVKLDWRLDWPARWWQMEVACEPFGRDHATKGGSYDTGVQLMKDVFEADAPMPVPYDFINMAGDTKKMSASKGTGLDALEASTIMPPEVMRFFILRSAPNKRLYFDPVDGVTQLMDEFAALCAKSDKTESEEQLVYICTHGQVQQTVSRVPFSHLVASYQASLKDAEKTLDVIKRTEHGKTAEVDAEIIRNELKFIDAWLDKRAPEDMKFSLTNKLDSSKLTNAEQSFLKALGNKVEQAPLDADGQWFHQAIYEQKDTTDLPPKEMFSVLYRVLIGKTSGPRAGWFLSILPRDWLIDRLKLKA